MPWFRILSAANAAVLGILISGCSVINQLPVVLFIAFGVNNETEITIENKQRAEQRLKRITNVYTRSNPNVKVQIAIYPTKHLINEIRKRSDVNLGPDLIISNSYQANELLSLGLTTTVPNDQDIRDSIFQDLIPYVSNERGELSAVPTAIFIQLACFNRDTIKTPPKQINELLEISAAGDNVALSGESLQLLWTMGSLGALPAINKVALGETLEKHEYLTINRWMQWLQLASKQQKFKYLRNQSLMRDQLISGELDWITCTSEDIKTLRKGMGSKLGVAPLPNGAKNTAWPTNTLRTLSLGKDSSQRQRKAALELINFIMSPILQRRLMLESQDFLPSNRNIKIPTESSFILNAMITSVSEQSSKNDHYWNSLSRYPMSTFNNLTIILANLVDGLIIPTEATEQLVELLRRDHQ